MGKPTPGPWHDCGKHGIRSEVLNECGEMTEICHGTTRDNAQLIITAPKLVRDLEEATKLVAFLYKHLQGRMGESALEDMIERASSWASTIAKAKGESVSE